MPDSRLNRAERALQQSFRKLFAFNSLLVGLFVLLAYWPMRDLPDRKQLQPSLVALSIQPVALPRAQAPLTLAGAWILRASDPRFGGLSGLAIDHGQFLAVSDLGAVIRFNRPSTNRPRAAIHDLRSGPGRFGNKWSRDAESIARDPQGRGWWIGYEQRHSLWLYDEQFDRTLAGIDLKRPNWRDNRGAEGLLIQGGRLLVLAENGRDAVRIEDGQPQFLKLHSSADVAEGALAPDGSAWALLRTKGLDGIREAIAPVIATSDGFRTGNAWPLPKEPFDNFEGMAIEARPGGGWRFWLVTDDGHRVMARTLLVALDYQPPAEHEKSPAPGAGPSKKPSTKSP